VRGRAGYITSVSNLTAWPSGPDDVQRADQRIEGCLVASHGSKSKWLIDRQAQSVCHTL